MKNPLFFIIGALMLLCSISCADTDCKNSNSIFDTKTPDTKEYQEELIKALGNKAMKTTFTLERYEEKDGTPYLYMHVQQDGLCATAIVLVLDGDEKIKNVQNAKGDGYAGAEFKNLRYKVFRDDAKTVLLYQGVDSIVD